VPPKCNADALTEQGAKAYHAGQFAVALAAYEAAYSCKPTSEVLRPALMSACSVHDVAKARSTWRRLPLERRTRSLVEGCERNGITEVMLNAP
jgi:hypothetical protein